ncbi:MAG: saccharopine dehydrogenase NADP-binding domain-containing protein, partial [Gammaproteobacteria bacterium]|nr:saccharopine dehydrogenase NADP-binding domain-containing protein [Gammaproteobacteria bacterium]
MKNKKTVLVLGGYGNFGKRICESLSVRSDIHLIVAGRYEDRAIVCCDDLIANGANCTVAASVVDINSDNFREKLAIQTPDIVIHTAGPFQGQDYRVANTCIEIGCHYIDLADDRRFVCNFKKLAKLAKDKNVIAISGASSVPG